MTHATGIPKIIHQTFATSALPPELLENQKRLKEINPSWEYRFYEDKDIEAFISNNYSARILDYFKRINPAYGAARADFFRYLLVYKCGGVYLDIKSSTLTSLDQVLMDDDAFVLSHWQNKKGEEFEDWGLHSEIGTAHGEFQQWHVIATAGHPFLKAVIENIMRNIDIYLPSLHGVGQHGVIRLTGPIAYTEAILPLLKLHRHRIVDSKADLRLQYSIYDKFSHMKIYKKKHYTVLTEPLVNLGGAKKALDNVLVHLKSK